MMCERKTYKTCMFGVVTFHLDQTRSLDLCSGPWSSGKPSTP